MRIVARGVWYPPIHTTTVVYIMAVKERRFLVSGLDESDGIALRISNTRWDGDHLYFVSLFPPTNHKAHHVFRLIGKARASHEVNFSDEEVNFTDNEVWKRSPRGRTSSASRGN